MTLKDVAKFKRKLTFGLKTDIRNLVNFHQTLRTLLHIEGVTIFKKGQLQAGLKQLNFKQNPC